MFVNHEVAPSSPLKTTVRQNFQRNLADLVASGRRQQVKILLNTVAVNKRDCPPFASLIAADGSSAQTAYEQGKNALAQGDYAAAGKALQHAVDWDALPFRTDAEENEIIRQLAMSAHSDSVRLFDADRDLGADNPDHLCGEETFYEHVHFNAAGAYRLGTAWAREVDHMLPSAWPRNSQWGEATACAERLGLSGWNQAIVWDHMCSRLQVPPLATQTNNALRLAALSANTRLIRQSLTPDLAIQVGDNFQHQLKAHPADFMLRENYAIFLQATGNLTAAQQQWEQLQDQLPHDYLPPFQCGRLAALTTNYPAAMIALQRAVTLRPDLTEGWLELGQAAAGNQQYESALAAYATAQTQRPQDAKIMFRIGQVKAATGDHAAARQVYQKALQLNPADWEVHYAQAGEWDALGNAPAALAEFAAAVQLHPDSSRTHYNYGVLLAKTGRLDEAGEEFATALKWEPGYKNAEDGLAKIQILKHRKQ